MYCPQCGQQQVADTIRFCSRCGFPLEGVATVIHSGGQLPVRGPVGKQPISPRSKGVRQGAMLMLSTLLIVPITAVITVNFYANPELLVPLAALLCFVGGLLRILYALIMEDSTPQLDLPESPHTAGPPRLDHPVHHAALPPPAVNAASGWRSRPNTAELYQPPSVTENTTRLLDKDDPNKR
jgi:hypothetical protein